MHTNEVSNTIADNYGNTTPQIDRAANLALAKITFLGLGKLTSLDNESLSPFGSDPDQEQEEEEENTCSSIDSTNCPSDEGAHEMIHGGTMKDAKGCNDSPLHDQSNSVQTSNESGFECEAIEQVSRLLGEMADILDESVCSSTSTSKNACDSDSDSDKPISPLASTASNAPEQPKLPINLSLLRQMANINTNLRDITANAAGDGQSTLVEGNILVETIEILLAERTEMFQEVLSLLEAAREETRALRDLPRYNADGAACGVVGGHSPGSKIGC